MYAPDLRRSGRREILCWRIGDPQDKAIRLTFDSSTDVSPSLFIPGRGGDPVAVPLAVNPIKQLKLQRLAKYKSAVAKATSYSPIIRELTDNKDPEASRIIRTLEEFGRSRFQLARREKDIFKAQSIYIALSRKFDGHPIGKQAAAVLKLDRFKRELKAAPDLVKLRELTARLRAGKGVKSRYDDKKFFARNRAVLVQMVQLTVGLQKNHPETQAQREALGIARKYALPNKTADAGNQRLVIDATIVATSKVPTIKQIAPYKAALTYIRYKLDKVVGGDYDKGHIVVVHWVIQNRKHTAVAAWKPGMRQRLTVDLFDAHADLQKITKTQDADDFELVPYWALKVESQK